MFPFIKDMTGAHQSSKTAKVLSNMFWHMQRAKCFLLNVPKLAKTCTKAFLLFAWLMCASHIFNKRKHVLAKALLPKAALLDWSAPGLSFKFATKWNCYQSLLFCTCRIFWHFSLFQWFFSFWSVKITVFWTFGMNKKTPSGVQYTIFHTCI